tara:strand:- start:1834 stop:2013 length:180 start_codon:yes stop_codon:yes gene_type:complete
MQFSVTQALVYAHSQVLEILDNHWPTDSKEVHDLNEQLIQMAWDLQNEAGVDPDVTQDL